MTDRQTDGPCKSNNGSLQKRLFQIAAEKITFQLTWYKLTECRTDKVNYRIALLLKLNVTMTEKLMYIPDYVSQN